MIIGVRVVGMFLLLLILALGSAYSYTGCSDPSLDTEGKSCVEVTDCGTLTAQNTYYLVINDVSNPETCMNISADNVVLDLNDHIITYADVSFAQLYNGDFEIEKPGNPQQADGWDFSQAPNVQRYAGQYYSAQIWGGAYGLKIANSGQEQVLTSTNTVTLSPGVKYVLSAHYYNTVNDSVTIIMEVLDPADTVLFSTEKSGRTWRGMQFFPLLDGPPVTPFSVNAPTEVRVRIRFTNTGVDEPQAGDVYLDYLRLITQSNYGINNIPRRQNIVIKNGEVKIGTHHCGLCHAILGGFLQNSLITNLTVHVGGVKNFGLYAAWTYNLNIINNTFIHNNYYQADPNDVVIVRDWFYSLILTNSNDGLGPQGNNTIANNRVWGSPQGGIWIQSTPETLMSYVYGNDIRHNTKYTQGFALMLYGTDNVEAYNNFINLSSGRGIALNQGINQIVHDNEVYVAEQRNQEYTASMIGYGIQVETGSNSTIYNNYVVATTHPNNGQGAALRFTSDSTNVSIFNNTFIGINKNPELGESFYATAFSGYYSNASTITLDHNTFKSNNRIFEFFDANNFLFENSVIEKLDND